MTTAFEASAKGIRLVAVGGGDREAFEAFLAALPAQTGIGFVVVSNAGEPFDALRAGPLPIKHLRDRLTPEPDRVYVVPPDRDVVLADGALVFAEHVSQARAPIDRLMRSLADELGGD